MAFRSDKSKLWLARCLLLAITVTSLYSCQSIHLAYQGRSDDPAFAKAHYISYSSGGSLLRTRLFLSENPAHKMVIAGPCISACTLVLARPNVCWTHSASFWVHGVVSNGRSSRYANSLYRELLPASFARHLPERLVPNYFHVYSGQQVARLMGRQLCR